MMMPSPLNRSRTGSRYRFSWMRISVAGVLIVLAMTLQAMAMDQAKPGETGGVGGGATMADPHGVMGTGISEATLEKLITDKYMAQNRTAFDRDIQLDDVRLMSIQNLDQVKILDSWARQSLRKIRHRESIDGKDPVLLALDMAFRPEFWKDKNVIYVESVPIREELGAFVDAAEAHRIREEALVSSTFLEQRNVASRLMELGNDSRQVSAVSKLFNAYDTLVGMSKSLTFLPPTADMRKMPWVNPEDFVNEAAKAKKPAAVAIPMAASQPAASLPPYTAEQKLRIVLAYNQLVDGWQDNDAKLANQGLSSLYTIAQTIDPENYTSHFKRDVELWYNRTFSGTLVAFVYFTALVLFFLTAVGITPRTGKTYKAAITFYSLALICHVTAMGIRWWISGRIPIQNQFESVMGSACLGCCVGLTLESWKRTGIFGTAFAFVGFIAATTLLAAPYVFGTNLGADPGKVAGILNTFWLYIHVNIVISSYALIFASAAIGGIYLLAKQWYWVNPLEPGFEDESGSADDDTGPAPSNKKLSSTATTAAAVALSPQLAQVSAQRAAYLDTLDQANMVVLQMAMWMLGVGIMCGAVWADQSWGRPWGWDPKETFALVTWIVYLVIVHVRLVIKQKGTTTAALSLAGCGIMLFNWIGVNFFLKGLHSYA